MTNQIKVSEVMTKSVIVANVNSTFTEVMRFFTEYKIQHLPVAEGDRIIGIISLNDMMSFFFKEVKKGRVDHISLNETFHVAEVMTSEPITISPDDTVGRVVDLLSSRNFQALPVTRDGVIQGIVTNKDLVRMLQWEYTH
jgi:acetoin utilization protein AcuB